jgi:hypothetical protein
LPQLVELGRELLGLGRSESTLPALRAIQSERSSMKSALQIHVHVGEDHVIKLPDEVPVGPAQIIVLVEETPTTGVLDDFEPIEPARAARLSDLVIEDRD